MSLIGSFLKGLREGLTDGDPRPSPARGHGEHAPADERRPVRHGRSETKDDAQASQKIRRRDFGHDDTIDDNRPEPPEPPAPPRPTHREEPPEVQERPAQENRTRHPPRLRGNNAVQIAREYLTELTAREPEAVSGLSPGQQGWKVRFEVVEVPRVPATTDVMATFEVELDEAGGLLGCRRIARYYRNEAHGEE